MEPVQSKRRWLSIHVPAVAIAAFSSFKESPWISSAQQYPSYSSKQQEAVRNGSRVRRAAVTNASQCTTTRRQRALKLASQATASAENSRLKLSSVFHMLWQPHTAEHQLQTAEVSQWHRSDFLKGKTQKPRSSPGASHFQLYIFPATLTNSCSSIHSSKRWILLLPIFIGKWENCSPFTLILHWLWNWTEGGVS